MKEKQIEEIAKDLKENLRLCAGIKLLDHNIETIAYELSKKYQLKAPEDSVVLSKEEYESIRNSELNLDWEVDKKVKEELDRVEKEASKEMAKKILNTEFFVFETENRSEEYQKGYMQAVRECRSRRDEIAKQFDIEIKE